MKTTTPTPSGRFSSEYQPANVGKRNHILKKWDIPEKVMSHHDIRRLFRYMLTADKMNLERLLNDTTFPYMLRQAGKRILSKNESVVLSAFRTFVEYSGYKYYDEETEDVRLEIVFINSKTKKTKIEIVESEYDMSEV